MNFVCGKGGELIYVIIIWDMLNSSRIVVRIVVRLNYK